MDDLDRRIHELLSETPQGWQQRAAELRDEVNVMYEQKMKRAATLTHAGTAIGVCLMFLGVAALIYGVVAGVLECTIVGAMMFLFGDGWITGSKLLYWTWNSRIRVEREVKEVRAGMFDLTERLDRIERAVTKPSTDAR